MTLIAMFTSPDRVLMAADGMSVYVDPEGKSPPNAERRKKVRPIGDRPLVFGMTGPSEPQEELDEWLATKHPPTWRQFARILGDEVSQRNGTMRAAIRSAGLDPLKEQGLQVIVAGFLGDVPGSAIALNNGRSGYSTGDADGAEFIGLYDGVARVARRLMRTIVPDYELDTPEKMHGFLDAICTYLPEILHPVDVWEITPGNSPEKMF